MQDNNFVKQPICLYTDLLPFLLQWFDLVSVSFPIEFVKAMQARPIWWSSDPILKDFDLVY